tara:strand:- start:766 stop:3720 length:2955 start_codon:yes stop_codon:yes gene_type:complete
MAIASDELHAGRIFYCSWDAALKPDMAAGAESWTGDYQSQAGHSGNALKITDTPVTYMPNGNFTREIGTLSLWFKLDKNDQADRMGIVSATNFRFQNYRKNNQAFFMTGSKLPGKNFKWDYSLLLHNRDVPFEQWIHLVLTWDSKTGQRHVYLNGVLAGKTKSNLIETGAGSQSLKLGINAPGLYDELNIWNIVLSEEQIRSIYQHGTPAVEASNAHTKNEKADWLIEPKLVYLKYSDSLVDSGQPIELKIPFVNNTSQQQKMTARLQIMDTWEQPVGAFEDITLDLAPSQKKTVKRSYTVDRYGCYKLRITDTGNPDLLKEITSFGCLPKGTPPNHPFFGAHVNGTRNMPEMARRIGFSKNRVHNMTQFTWWDRLEPQKGEWDIKANQQRAYQRYLDLGFEHYGQWFGAPYWAVKKSDGTHPADPKGYAYPNGMKPSDEKAFRQYITRSIESFPQIKQWEMWNEPYVSRFFHGSPDQYFEICRMMYQQAKSVRPDLEIFAQLPYDSPWLDRVLELGILNYCDGVAFHNYYSALAHPQSIIVSVNKIRKRLKDYGKENIPLINSESGLRGTTFLRGLDIPEYSPEQLKKPFQFREAACMNIQSNVVLMSLGLQARYFYFHQPVNIQKGRAYPTYTTCEITRSPLPMAISQAALVWQLDGGKFVKALTPTDGLRVYLFARNDGKTLAVVWCEDQAKVQLTVQQMQSLDMMGNPLENQQQITISDEPVLMVSNQNAHNVINVFENMKLQVLAAPKVHAVSAESNVDPLLPPMPDFQVATEVGLSKLKPVDLSAFVNMGFADPIQGDGKGGWTDEGPNNDARMINPGSYNWFGVPFVIPGKTNLDPSVVSLGGMTFSSGPKSVGPIPVNQSKVRGLFFAHAANWMSGKITEVPVIYTVTYQDGSTVDIPMRGGREINNWWSKPGEDEEGRAIQMTHPDPITRSHASRYLRICYWENPKTSVPVSSIAVRTNGQKSTYILCGITVAKW